MGIIEEHKLEYQIKYLEDHRKQCIESKNVNWYVIDAIKQAIELLQAQKENRLLILPDGLESSQYIAIKKSIKEMLEPIMKRAEEGTDD